MTVFKISDNSQIDKNAFVQVGHVTTKIADKTLEQLDREGVLIFPAIVGSDDLEEDQVILQSVNDCYRTGNVMGYIGSGDERLIIGSRFGNDGNDYFLQYLLGKVLNFPNVADLQTDSNSDNRLLNLYVFLFPYYLHLALRKGMFKTYIRNEYNDANIKGPIDVARHIKVNTPFVGNIAYGRREYAYDNYLTELVRHTVEYIKKKPYGYNLLVKVKDEVQSIITHTPRFNSSDMRRIVTVNKQNPLRHAYYREYRMLQRLCLLILQHEKHQIGVGSQQMHGILFDGAWLWEEYINTLIKDEFYHPMNKVNKGAQRLFTDGSGIRNGLIYPDFLSRNDRPRIVADAKYRPIGNIGNSDYLQVLAYMYRFDATIGFYLYPEEGEADDKCLWLNAGSTYESNVKARNDVCVIKHGLKIPVEATTYDDFAASMHQSESEFLKLIYKYVQVGNGSTSVSKA
ncbi:MAG: hypothetical protein J1G02_00095 [Clostridiales bacterium]|nr:hypothetical protein [Clostridiales bacterium]